MRVSGINLESLKPNKGLINTYTIIAFDIETYTCKHTNLQKPFAVGVFIPRNNKFNMFYIESGEDSYDFIVRVFKELFTKEYFVNKSPVYYIHNLSGFDITFLLEVISRKCVIIMAKYLVLISSLIII